MEYLTQAGLRDSDRQKRQAAVDLFADDPDWRLKSTSLVAKRLGVSWAFADKFRRLHQDCDSPDRFCENGAIVRRGPDGRYRMMTAVAGSRP